jgi:hypothetical protein
MLTMNPPEVFVRHLSSLVLLAALSACAVEPDAPIVDDPIEDPEPEFDHICDALKYEAAQAGAAWTPGELEDCFAGCDAGAAAGFDQGRLVCLMDGEYCPECVADQDGETYDAGYKACFADSYREGYGQEGCLEP